MNCSPAPQMGMTKKPFVHPLRDSLTPADLRLRPLLGAFRTSGAVPSGLFSHSLSPTCETATRQIYIFILHSANVRSMIS